MGWVKPASEAARVPSDRQRYTVLSAGGVLKLPQLEASKLPSGDHARRDTAQVCPLRIIDLTSCTWVWVGIWVVFKAGIKAAVDV
jgi:hypothetical protein